MTRPLSDPPSSSPDTQWDAGVAVREPGSPADSPTVPEVAPGLLVRAMRRFRRVARFLYQLLTETP